MNKNLLVILAVMAIILNACSDKPATQDNTSIKDTAVSQNFSAETKSSTAIPNPAKTDTCTGPGAISKLKKNTSLAVLTGMTDEEAKDWKPGDESGVTDFAIDTLFNDHCILCIRAEIDYMGAYPSHANEYHVYNLHTGEAIPIKDVLNLDKIPELVALCNRRLQDSIKKDRAERMITDKEVIRDYDDAIKEHPSEFTREDLEHYYITTKEIVFIHQFGYPHVIQALEPNGEIKFSRKDFKTYLKPGGLLDF